MRSLSAIIGDAARAFRRLAPMAFAEASAHALVAHDASDQVTAAAGQAYMHRLPRIRPPCFAGFRNRRTDGCGGQGLGYRAAVPAPQASGVDARLRASRREQAPGVDARLRASVPQCW